MFIFPICKTLLKFNLRRPVSAPAAALSAKLPVVSPDKGDPALFGKSDLEPVAAIKVSRL
ncbi:hypothetical protein TAL182_CH01249 [Rhizobium sp. TAL182]|nr:hypothetical protein TAL182_CH01249 [Rhizobium sp. TAL182]